MLTNSFNSLLSDWFWVVLQAVVSKMAISNTIDYFIIIKLNSSNDTQNSTDNVLNPNGYG